MSYFSFENVTDGELWSIKAECNTTSGVAQPFNLYASKGLMHAPSRFHNDLIMTNFSSPVTISQDVYDCSNGCVFALEAIGFDQASNTASTAHVVVTLNRQGNEAVSFVDSSAAASDAEHSSMGVYSIVAIAVLAVVVIGCISRKKQAKADEENLLGRSRTGTTSGAQAMY